MKVDKKFKIKKLIRLDFKKIVSSTNSYLIDYKNIKFKYHICFADYQTFGRGQILNKWYSNFGENLCFSIKFFENVISENYIKDIYKLQKFF